MSRRTSGPIRSSLAFSRQRGAARPGRQRLGGRRRVQPGRCEVLVPVLLRMICVEERLMMVDRPVVGKAVAAWLLLM